MKERQELIKALGTIFGCSFISIKGYESSTGEVSNHTINVGVLYENSRKRDIEILKGVSFDGLKEEARVKILNSLEKNAKEETKSNQSIGQLNAYVHINKAVKLHIEKGELYIYGMAISKEVLVEAVNPKKKTSNPLLQMESVLKKELNLSTSKFRMFKFSVLKNVRVSGRVLSFGNQMEIVGFE